MRARMVRGVARLLCRCLLCRPGFSGRTPIQGRKGPGFKGIWHTRLKRVERLNPLPSLKINGGKAELPTLLRHLELAGESLDRGIRPLPSRLEEAISP